MKTLTMCSALAIVISTSALAQLTTKYMDWAEGPERHLMTKEEVKQWKTVHSDAEAEAFIDLFWARRDPTPDTRLNEFRDDFEQRVKFADDNFSDGRQRGAVTDRGKAFILLGPPYRVSSTAGAPLQTDAGGRRPNVDAQGNLTVLRPVSDPDRQIWMYAHERKPKFVTQSDFTLIFLDEGRNDWKLAHTERANPDLILQQAAIASIVSPKLTKVPVYANSTLQRTTTFRNAALKTAYEQFRSGDQTIGNANLTWGEFVTSEGDHFVSAQLYVPAGGAVAPDQKVTSFAVVENGSGQIVDIKEEEATTIASGTDAFVDRSLELEAGTYTTTLGIAADGKVLAASRTTMKVEGLDPAATAVSPLFLASSIYPLQTTWHATDPFTFGGLKVIPKGDSVFATAGDLWYFVELRNPGVTDAGKPNVRVKVDIKGKTQSGAVALNIPIQDVELAKFAGEKSRYGLGLSIPLEGFKPGDYTMKVHVVDVVLGKNYDFEKQFRVRG